MKNHPFPPLLTALAFLVFGAAAAQAQTSNAPGAVSTVTNASTGISVTAPGTAEWTNSIYGSGNPTSEVVSNRICYSAEEWCLRAAEITSGYSKDQAGVILRQVESIRKHRFTTQPGEYVDPITWTNVIGMSKLWYALPSQAREAFEKRRHGH